MIKRYTPLNKLAIRQLKRIVKLYSKSTKKNMSVYIKLIRNNIKSNRSYGKYFAKAVSQGEVTLEDIAAEACRNSGFSEGSVIGVATEIQDIMKQRLRDGQTVVLPGIGRFSLRVESIGVDDPKQFNIGRHITRIICGFLPAGRRIAGGRILYDLCEGVKAVWQKGFKP